MHADMYIYMAHVLSVGAAGLGMGMGPAQAQAHVRYRFLLDVYIHNCMHICDHILFVDLYIDICNHIPELRCLLPNNA